MRILVTGGNGYLGSVLVPRLMQDGHKVTVVDIQPPLCDCEFVAGDIRDMRLIQPLLHRSDAVIPLAGIVGAPACDERHYAATTTNRYAIVDLLSRVSPGQKVIFPATDSGYPPGVVDESSVKAPISHYAVTKHAAEMAVLANGGVTLRLASVFGMSPRMRADLIVNNFVLHAINRKKLEIYEPNYRRTFCHIKDIASSFVRALTLDSGAYNVGNSLATMTKLELARTIGESFPGFRYHVVEGKHDPDRRDAFVSYEKIEATGWSPEYGINYGIAELREGLSSEGAV